MTVSSNAAPSSIKTSAGQAPVQTYKEQSVSGVPTSQSTLNPTGNDQSTPFQRVRKRDRIRQLFDSTKPEAHQTIPAVTLETRNHHTLGASTEAKSNKSNSTPNAIGSSHVVGSAPIIDLSMACSGLFTTNLSRPVSSIILPGLGARFDTTPQLVLCNSLLLQTQASSLQSKFGSSCQMKEVSLKIPVGGAQCDWIKDIGQNTVEQDHIRWLLKRMVEEFAKDAVKGSAAIQEVVLLGPVLDREQYRHLLSCFLIRFEESMILDLDLLRNLVQLVQGASEGCLEADDLIKVLRILRTHLQQMHLQSTERVYHLTLAVSRVLDVMAKHQVKDVGRVEEHEPLAKVLNSLRGDLDPFLMYQASYAFQALQCIPDDESALQAAMRHSGTIIMGLVNISGVLNLNLSAFLEGLEKIQMTVVDTIGIVKTASEGARSLIESGHDVLEAIKEGISARNKRAWYPAILGAETFVQEGRLADFKVLVLEAACRNSHEFQWGICQLLGQITTDPVWDSAIRQEAVNFLSELYSNDPYWGRDVSVKSLMVTIFRMISDDANQVIKVPSGLKKRHLDDAAASTLVQPYPLKPRLPPPTDWPLLTRVQNIPYVERDLYRLRDKQLQGYNQKVYIPPMAKISLQASDEDTLPLMQMVKEFLNSAQQVFLVLGDSGAGKSTFNRHLEQELWKEYKQGGSIPLFINLPAVVESYRDLIGTQLQIDKFSEVMIKELKENRKMIVICDGYDETQLRINLHTANMLNQRGQAVTKMIISCRSTYLGQDYRDQFHPQHSNRYIGTAANLCTEAVIVPFSSDQIKDYVNQFVRHSEAHLLMDESCVWSTEDYMSKLRSIPHMMELIRNPFLLSLSLNALPRVVKDAGDPANVKVTRLTLYDSFTEQWLDINRRRLMNIVLSVEVAKALQELLDEGFALSAIEFLKDLSAAIFKEQDGNPVVQYMPRSDKGSWKAKYFGSEPDTALLRESSPLSRAGVQHRFIHRSLLEYFYSRHIYEASETQRDVVEGTLDLAVHPLSQRDLVREPSIIQFLAEHVQGDSVFQQRLYDIVERSKSDSEASQAAANAITILVRAGVAFIGADLRGIRIPGADLSGGQFDSALLQGADLRSVNLRSIWLRQADLSNAEMAGVQFDELPHLSEENVVESCAYSPDGKTLAVGLGTGEISFYNILTWKKTHELVSHTNAITSIMFSPDGQELASGSYDKTVRFWNAQTGAPGTILCGHMGGVTSVAFSPENHQIASGSHDMTARLWNTLTGALDAILSGHDGAVTSVAFSPSGQMVATGGEDGTVRLWNTQTGGLGIVLRGHTGGVSSVVFSPSGQHVASGGDDRTVRLWDPHTGALNTTVRDHGREVTAVAFSPNGRYVASGSEDKSVRIRDMQTGVTETILSGHIDYVTSIAFSPCGQQIASGGQDETVRLWSVQASVPSPVQHGHTRQVKSVAFSPSGRYVASGSEDKMVRLWDAQTGEPSAVLAGHTHFVTSVAFSSDGQQIASSSWDKTVRLWDAHTKAPGPILSGHTQRVTSVVFSPNGREMASGSSDNTVRLWDTQHGVPYSVLRGHTEKVTSVAYSPDGQQIASGSGDSTLRLWDVETSTLRATLYGHSSIVTGVAFSPNGQQLASSSWDNTLRLWDTRTGQSTATLRGHTWCVTNVAFAPGGQLIASGSWDETVRFWDVNSGRCLAILKDVHGSARSVAWDSTLDGTIIVGSGDMSVRLWKVEVQEDSAFIRLQWSSMHGQLALSDAIVHNVHGLSRINRKLLKQRGALLAPKIVESAR